MITDVGNPWGRWNLYRNIPSSQGRFWLATAGAWWSCGIWAHVKLSSSSWANRYLVNRAECSCMVIFDFDFSGTMKNFCNLFWCLHIYLSFCVCVCVCARICVSDFSPCSSWRAWCGNVQETCLSVLITMEATLCGLLLMATPAISSQCPPPSHMVRSAYITHRHTSFVLPS